MMSVEEAREFAEDWITGWNDHDLDRILAHYAEDMELVSPLIVAVAEEPSGMLIGKTNVRAYWTKALERVPDLVFELIDVFVGVDSMVIYYKSVFEKTAAEVLFFGADGKVKRSIAHYD